MSVCPDCHGDGEVASVASRFDRDRWEACPRCHGTGELEPAGESVQARAERERVLQGGLGVPFEGEEAGE